ncbi:glycosyltransferase involved in cell wall biosynthesis [Leptospira meyeri]|uniref:Glycosyltransferase involved in cell wall biosynthesis n=1 Tax=Leptospira meyeri TaxID=29508 RepID=A0A4R8MPF7_LEPME|nr:glycosyltransferase family 2 protein [Leptospira meyeri]EKJ88789.1 glycosyltransferase, group 2 family protein [Leptospira meyeri serovar Hardjo str. Went 5]TDY71209.1 glycosyltransferase involved in cell wall biosynthesis [Leptospira meyeri]
MNHKKPIVSIITVVRNAEDTILRTIKSALSQKNVNFEVIVWDGLSTDRTVEQLESVKDQIRFYSGKDSGVYDAMNQSLPLAKGDWILFLNADDYFLDEYALEKLASRALDDKCDYVCGFASMLFGLKVWRPKTLTDFDFFVGNPSNHQAYLCKKSVYLKLGGFDLRYRYSADVDFMFRVIKEGYLGQIVKESVVHYSLGGLSTKNVSRGVAELEQIMAKFLNADVNFARECRLVFHEGKIHSKQFIENLISLRWSDSQWKQIVSFLGSKYSLESTPFFTRLFSLIQTRLLLLLKAIIFQFLRILPNRVL